MGSAGTNKKPKTRQRKNDGCLGHKKNFSELEKKKKLKGGANEILAGIVVSVQEDLFPIPRRCRRNNNITARP